MRDVRRSGREGGSRYAGQEEQRSVQVLLQPTAGGCCIAKAAKDRAREVAHAAWVNGSSEVSGVVASSNSLIGTQTGDTVGLRDALGCKVTPLSNGN